MKSLLITAGTAALAGEAAVYAVAFAGVLGHYIVAAHRAARPLSLPAFARHLLPYNIVVSRWTRLDIAFYVLDKLMFALIFPSVSVMVAVAAHCVQSTLHSALGTAPAIQQDAVTITIFVICGLLVRDFAAFYIHLMQHRVPLLWEFHKVHHAPETLVPPTGRRLHPLDQFLGMATEAPLLGMIVGSYAWLTHQGTMDLIIYSAGFYALVNVITFAPLRHSHIDLRLGVVEKLFLSPAHHRLHHSLEPPHWDKNFAAVFPLWDWMFGTLLEPPARATYRLGLPDGGSVGYATLLACYVEPFRRIQFRLETRGLGRLLRPGAIARHPPVSPDVAPRTSLMTAMGAANES